MDAANPGTLRVLIFHIRISMGHERAAQALAAAFRSKVPGADVRLVEAIGYSSGWLAPVVCRSYLSIIKHAPGLWDFLYGHPNARPAAGSLLRTWTRRSQKKFLGLMAAFRPHAVLCTQALPARILATLKEWGYAGEPGMRAPLYAVATDFSVHPYWAAEQIDGYFLPGADEFETLKSMGVPAEKIFTSGIPILPAFAEAPSDESLRTARLEYGIEEGLPTLMFMGGSRGIGLRKGLIHELERLPSRVNILALAGTNPILMELFRSWAAESRHRVIPLEYSRDMRPLYALSDVAITKPGGLTLAECMAVGLPMLVPFALPGQERYNLEFLRRHQLAEIAVGPSEVASRVQDLLASLSRRAMYANRLKSHARPSAALDIVDTVLDALGEAAPPACPGPYTFSRGH
ncbi:hypothetical protein HY522_06435 [bacterium]|nr:hypothetical protein [bacterium]